MKIQILPVFAAAFFATGSIRALPPELAPPPGPPGAVMKTLDEVEPRTPISEIPFTITEPGSYYLIGNLTGVAGENGITIAEGVDNVTIDLMGFTLQGVEGSLRGITSSNIWSTGNNYTVRNGYLVGFGSDGIYFPVEGTGRLIEQLHVSGNGGTGIRGLANGALVHNSIVSRNHGIGIWAGDATVIKTCTIIANGSGIFGGAGILITDCNISYNTREGVFLEPGNRIVNTMARRNGDHGIVVSIGSIVKDCTATSNGGDGIRVISPGHILGGESENVIAVESFGQRTMVVGSIADDNGGAGIYVFGGSARIEGNHLSRNSIGIHIESTGNLIVKNSAAENTEANFSIIEGNEVGPIGTMSEVGQHPWANFVPSP